MNKFDYLLIPSAAMLICALLHLSALKLFPKIKLLDFPERYGLARNRLPYPTGILAIITFIPFLLYSESFSVKSAGTSAAIAILGIYSFTDDIRPLPPLMRLAAQALAAFIVFTAGSRIYTITNPLGAVAGMSGLIKLDTIDIMTNGLGPLPILSAIFTVIWLILIINALNWFDGIPGQVSALSSIGFLVIGFLSLSERVNQPQLAMLSFILAGIAWACLIFDFPPPKVLMGDTGAMFFGLMLGVLTIYAGGKVATAFLVMGVPLIDSILVALSRILKGRSPFKGSTFGEHMHHRLLSKGWSERKIIFLTVLLGSLFGISALFQSTTDKFVSAAILFLVIVVLRIYAGKNLKLKT